VAKSKYSWDKWKENIGEIRKESRGGDKTI